MDEKSKLLTFRAQDYVAEFIYAHAKHMGWTVSRTIRFVLKQWYERELAEAESAGYDEMMKRKQQNEEHPALADEPD